MYDSIGAYADIHLGDSVSQQIQQRLVATTRPERAVAVDLFFRSHLPDKPMDADASRISRVKARNVVECVFLGVDGSVCAAALQKAFERLIRFVVTHPRKDFIDFAKGHRVKAGRSRRTSRKSAFGMLAFNRFDMENIIGVVCSPARRSLAPGDCILRGTILLFELDTSPLPQ
jgi:hypothetical protein